MAVINYGKINNEATSIVTRGIDAGLFREVDVALTTYHFVNFVHTWALKHWRLKTLTEKEEYIRQGVRFYSQSLGHAQRLATLLEIHRTKKRKSLGLPDTRCQRAVFRAPAAVRRFGRIVPTDGLSVRSFVHMPLNAITHVFTSSSTGPCAGSNHAMVRLRVPMIIGRSSEISSPRCRKPNRFADANKSRQYIVYCVRKGCIRLSTSVGICP